LGEDLIDRIDLVDNEVHKVNPVNKVLTQFPDRLSSFMLLAESAKPRGLGVAPPEGTGESQELPTNLGSPRDPAGKTKAGDRGGGEA
jgi:hypothetical protein